MQAVEQFEKGYMKKGSNVPGFEIGDVVKVNHQIVEAGKKRVQVFQGIVIARKGAGLRETFTVRKVSFGIGVEKTFFLHSPRVEKVTVVRHSKVRRAKLYYMRKLSGKSARLKERVEVETGAEKK